MGVRKAEYAGQLGLLFSPEEALSMGLVDEVCVTEDVMPKAEAEMEKWLSVIGNIMNFPAN